MDKSQVNLWLSINQENFAPEDLMVIKQKLESLDEDKLMLLNASTYQKPTTILLIAIFLGWERFWLEDIALGVVKILTLYGCGIWWLVDMFTAKKRAQKYNFKKLSQAMAFA
jgi:hypothetical protein